MEKKQSRKLLIEFPGRNYSCDRPLLYYCGKIFADRGYDVIQLDYNFRLRGNKDDIPSLIEEAKEIVLKQLDMVDFSSYDDIVFVSKSMGCAVAGFCEEHYNLRARHVFLTPVDASLKYMRRGKCIVIAGKEDMILESRKLKIYCVGQDVPLKQFEEVGHSLEHPSDINKTFAILMVIIRMFKEF